MSFASKVYKQQCDFCHETKYGDAEMPYIFLPVINCGGKLVMPRKSICEDCCIRLAKAITKDLIIKEQDWAGFEFEWRADNGRMD